MNYEYGEGPWSNEPDRLEFESHGLPCLMQRNRLGAWCGYVAVPPGHPMHGTRGEGLEAHGGINYAEPCSGEICHVPKPGEPDDVWWFGFDCAHCFDRIPWMEAQMKKDKEAGVFGMPDSFLGDEYRDVDYVKNQCIELAAQLCSGSP